MQTINGLDAQRLSVDLCHVTQCCVKKRSMMLCQLSHAMTSRMKRSGVCWCFCGVLCVTHVRSPAVRAVAWYTHDAPQHVRSCKSLPHLARFACHVLSVCSILQHLSSCSITPFLSRSHAMFRSIAGHLKACVRALHFFLSQRSC